jgi:NADH:ubiquinone oxidoreductase subunit 6 (subunit J)
MKEKKKMLLEAALAVGMIVSAFFAIFFKETLASVLSLSSMLTLLSLLYFSLNSPFAAVFQLTLGIGTAAVFLLAGDMLTKKSDDKTSRKQIFLGVVASILLSIPVLLGTEVTGAFTRTVSLSLSNSLWELRSIDIIAQGLVVLTVALGVAFLLRKERRRS